VRNLYGGNRTSKRVFKQVTFFDAEIPENMPDHFALVAASDADFQAWKAIGAEVLEDRTDAVVASVGAFFAEAEISQWEGGVIINDEHLRRLPLVEGEDLLHGAAAEIHEGLRLEQQGASRELGEVGLPLRLGFEGDACLGRQTVQHHEPDVVPGHFILPPRISEADDELERKHWEESFKF
jgi:hypothetical protein